jgi:hypothetical protein
MSMDLYAWKAPVVTDTEEARRLVELEDESVFEQSDDVAGFFAELIRRLPPPEALTEEELAAGATPWADSLESSGRLVSLSVRWSAADEDLETIVELARKYDLVLYDPQGPSFHSPGTDEAEEYAPGAGDFGRGIVLVLIGVTLAAGAWKISVQVLTWVLVGVGVFIVVVAVLSLVATVEQARRARRSR